MLNASHALRAQHFLRWYSEWGMRGCSVLGSVPLMDSGVAINSNSSWLVGQTQKSFMHYLPT